MLLWIFVPLKCLSTYLFLYQVMLSVNDHEEMGIQLLTVAGQRVAYEIFVRDIDSNFQHLAGMSTSLTRWLKTLVSSHLLLQKP